MCQNLSRRNVLLLASVGLAGCVSAPRARGAVILVSQPTVVNAADVGLGAFSSSHPRPTRNYKRGDDFRLTQAAELIAITWWGQSEGRIFDDLRNFDQYTVEIFESADAGSGPLPGALLWSGVFAVSDLTIEATGRLSPRSGAAEHRYHAVIGASVALESGRSYILAVSARSINPRGDAWQWQDGEFFGGHGASYSYAAGAWSAFQDTDSAFELIGRPVPAPATAITLGVMALTRRSTRANRVPDASLARRRRA